MYSKVFNTSALTLYTGWSDLGYASGEAITPNIDRLAKSGIILDKFYTYALCTPYVQFFFLKS